MTTRAPDKEYVVAGVQSEIIVQDIPLDARRLLGRVIMRSERVGSDDLLRLEINEDTDVNHYEMCANGTGFGGIYTHDNEKDLNAVPGASRAAGLFTVFDFWIEDYAIAQVHAMKFWGEMGNQKGIASTGWRSMRYFPQVPIQHMRWYLVTDDMTIGSRVQYWRQ